MKTIDIKATIISEYKWPMPAINTYVIQTTLGDFDNDGITDIAVTGMDNSALTNDIRILLARGNGRFIDGTGILEPQIPSYQTSNILSADLNFDGFTDLIVGRSGGDPDTTDGLYADTQLIYLSNSSGKYRPITSIESIYSHNVMIGDLNNDSLVDAFFFATGLGPSLLLMNRPTTEGGLFFTTYGLPDQAINSSPSDSWEVVERYPNGALKLMKGWHQHNTAFNDVNRDGHLDMVMFFGSGSREGLVYLNDGSSKPNFTTSPAITFNTVLEGVPSAGNYYYGIINEDGSWAGLRGIGQGANHYETVQFDINRDGWADIIAVATLNNRDITSMIGLPPVEAPNTTSFNHGTFYQALINTGSGLDDQTSLRIAQPNVSTEQTGHHYGHFSMLHAIDLNGDGHIDFMSNQNSGARLGIPSLGLGNDDSFHKSDTVFMLNDGNGQFNQVNISALEYGSFDPLPIDGKLGFISNVPPVANDWSIPGFPPRPYWETIFLKTNVPWTIGDDDNNFLYGTPANDKIFGQGGIDTFVAAGRMEEFNIQPDNNIITLIGLRGLTGRDNMQDVERIRFYDVSLAFDIDGNAGISAKILGAVFGADSISNKEYAGIGLHLLDSGMSQSDLGGLALKAAGLNLHDQIVSTLWRNIMGSVATDSEKAPYVTLLEEGLSPGELVRLAAETPQNVRNIDLVGLSNTGLEYLPFPS